MRKWRFEKWILFSIVVFVAFLMASMPISADDKKEKINILGGLGMSADNAKVFIDFGAEFKMSNGFYLQALINYDLSKNDYYDSYYPYPDYIGYYPGNFSVGASVGRFYGINVYSVFKQRVSRKVRFYVKGGVTGIFHSVPLYRDYYYGYAVNDTDAFLGLAGGLGVEYQVGKRVYWTTGATYKKIFGYDDNLEENPEAINRFIIHTGIVFSVKTGKKSKEDDYYSF